MVKTRVFRNLRFIALSAFLLGFRVETRGWNITREDPTVWLDFEDEYADFGFSKIEFSDQSDPLQDIDGDQHAQAIMQLVINDYNAVSTSFLRLAFHPNGAFPAEALAEDSPFSEERAQKRTIKISFGQPPGAAAGGAATSRAEGGHTVSCAIVMNKAKMRSAEDFKTTLTHELGHCLGLKHNHVDRQSIMSYNRDPDLSRLGVDDYMGLTYLYPEEESYAKEAMTFGMACSRTN